MACQKVCKQGRDNIIVKVNLQSLIPTSFFITVAKRCRDEAFVNFANITKSEKKVILNLQTQTFFSE